MSDNANIQGTWIPIKAELSGEAAPTLALEQIEVELSPNGYAVRFGGTNSDEGTYSLALGTPHKTITLLGIKGPNQDKTIPAIYQLNGDRLRICYALDDQGLPDEFRTHPGRKHYLVTYKRKTSSTLS